jgi:3-oxoacyl-[acyl-carrier protein] reductase
MTLHGKVALVTGASRGIGRTVAEHLARNGVSVVVNYYPTEWEDAEDTVRGIKQEDGTAIAVAGDVADAARVRSLFDIADEHFGRPDMVVLNAVLTQALKHAGPEVMEAEIAKSPLGRLGRPQDIADVVGLLVSEQAGWITGQLIGAGGGMF